LLNKNIGQKLFSYCFGSPYYTSDAGMRVKSMRYNNRTYAPLAIRLFATNDVMPRYSVSITGSDDEIWTSDVYSYLYLGYVHSKDSASTVGGLSGMHWNKVQNAIYPFTASGHNANGVAVTYHDMTTLDNSAFNALFGALTTPTIVTLTITLTPIQ
jgi:hypothetical protein